MMAIFTYGQFQTAAKAVKDTVPVKYDSLRAAVVTAVLRPRIKGDTLEYNTEFIKVRPNDLVEELLRRLPGLHIEADGSISFNGEKIAHLTIDGEDVFADDPTLVTRNFDASKIARVQILNRKSDRAIFTGLDDGSRVRTLNLVMKENSKNGYFGRMAAGGNTEGEYNATVAAADFRGKEQLVVLGLSGNTGVLGFSGGSGSPAKIGFLSSMADPLGASAGMGIPQFTATGLHFANRWQDLDEHLAANCQFGHSGTHPITTTETDQSEPGTQYTQRQRSESYNQQDQYSLRGQFDLAGSTKSAFRADFYSYIFQCHNQFFSSGSSAFNDTTVNSSLRSIRDQSNRRTFGGNASWRTGFGKKFDRIFSISAGFSSINNSTDGYLYSIDNFFGKSGILLQSDTIDQRKVIVNNNLTMNGAVTFVQPIFSGASMGFGYNFGVVNERPEQLSFARQNGKFNQAIDSLTSKLRAQTLTQQTTINIQGQNRHVAYIIGLDLLVFTYHQYDKIGDSAYRSNYGSWIPRLIVRYTPKPTIEASINYSESSLPPSIYQLAPIKNNNDPLHLVVGNPNLRPVTNQNLDLECHWTRSWLVGVSVALGFNNNNISSRTITDSLGRQVTEPLNVNGGEAVGESVFLNHKEFAIDWSAYLSSNYSRSFNYVNATLNRNDVYSEGVGIGATKYVSGKYNFQFSTGVSHVYSHNSINSGGVLSYWTQTHSGIISLFLRHDWELGTNANFSWQEKVASFGSGTSVLLWNAYVSRNMLHDKLVVKAFINDILDRNTGMGRSLAGNVSTQTETNILGRYWMLSVQYHFDKKFNK